MKEFSWAEYEKAAQDYKKSCDDFEKTLKIVLILVGSTTILLLLGLIIRVFS